ncbi:hypothetical protein SAMN04487972_10725 [Paracoccus halophilus]|nr:hypothetical protein SAMN04487972_10725 [Paracoccus halophilus]
MLVRLVTLLAILTISVVTAVSPAHALRMSPVSDQVAHPSAAVQVAADAKVSCHAQRQCHAPDIGGCKLVCAGLSVTLTAPQAEIGRDRSGPVYALPRAESFPGRAPELNDRPPRNRPL